MNFNGDRNRVPATLWSGTLFDHLFDQVVNEGYRSKSVACQNSATEKNFPVDIKEKESSYELVANVPGITKEQLEISLEKNRLSVSVNAQDIREKEDEEAPVTYLHRERRVFHAVRKFDLPHEVSSDISATLRDGILTITIKKDEAKQPRKIEIQ